MLNTAVSILAAIALLMPGFIIAELSVARSARSSRSDLELALRALAYTLIVHLAFGFWTVHLVKTIGSPEHWVDHLAPISAYVGVVLVGVPVALGAVLNRYIAHVEAQDGAPNLFAAALGAERPAMLSTTPTSDGERRASMSSLSWSTTRPSFRAW